MAGAVGGPLGWSLAQLTAEHLAERLEQLPVAFFRPPRWNIPFLLRDKPMTALEAARALKEGRTLKVQAEGQNHKAVVSQGPQALQELEAFYRKGPVHGLERAEAVERLREAESKGERFRLSDGSEVDAYAAFQNLNQSPTCTVRQESDGVPVALWSGAALDHPPADLSGLREQLAKAPEIAPRLVADLLRAQPDQQEGIQLMLGQIAREPGQEALRAPLEAALRLMSALPARGFEPGQVADALEVLACPTVQAPLRERVNVLDSLGKLARTPQDALLLYEVYNTAGALGCADEPFMLRLGQAYANLGRHQDPASATCPLLALAQTTDPVRLRDTVNLLACRVGYEGACTILEAGIRPRLATPLEARTAPKSCQATINDASTFRLNLPEDGWVVAKVHDTYSTRSHVEVLASEVDSMLPPAPGGSARVVPETFPLVTDATLRCKEGGQAPAAFYSAQKFVKNAVEFQQLVEREAVPTEAHPDLLRIRYLDMLCANRDRHSSNILMEESGRPHAIDNGYGFSTLNYFHPIQADPARDDYLVDWLNYNDIGDRPFCAVPQDKRREFLEQSLAYAERARAALTDQALERKMGGMKALYPDVSDWDQVLTTLKHNRDVLPEVIRASLARLTGG